MRVWGKDWSFTHMDCANRIQQPKGIEEPDEDCNHNSTIENPADLAIHRDVVVHQPKEHTYNDQGNNKRDQVHRQGVETLRA